MKQYLFTRLLFTGLLPTPLFAQVTLDGTLGHSGTLPGPNYQIGADLGQQHGGNLFHSFQDFNLQSHESASFSGPDNVQNVISRVTGGNLSHLDGTLRSTIPNANLYLLNPSGIMFGPNAKLEIQGSFHASTADYLRLGDGGRFEARQPLNSLLTVASVEAFGFLTSTPAPITLQDSHLSVSERQTLSLLGGDLSLSGQRVLEGTGAPRFNTFKHSIAPISIPMYTSQLTAPAGQINLASVAAAGEVKWIDSHLDLTSPLLGGSLRLDKIDLNVNGPRGGNIFIRAGQLKLTNSHLESQTLGDQDGGIIAISTEELVLRGGENYAGIHTNSWGAGTGSTIRLQARQMDFAEGVFINASTYQLGNPGNIVISATETLNFEGQYLPDLKLPSGIFSSVLSLQPDLDQDNSATLEVSADSLNLLNGAEIGSVTFGVKNSANIRVQVHDTLTVAGEIREDNNVFGDSEFTFPSGIISNSYMGSGMLANFGINYPTAGKAGNLQIQVHQLNMDDNALISSEAFTGHSGNIDIQGDQLSVTNGGLITTSTKGNGQGGKLQISVSDQVYLSARGHPLRSSQGASFRLTGLQAAAFTNRTGMADGNGGTIEVQAKRMVVEDLAQVAVISETDGNAGRIHLRVEQLEIRSGFVLSTTIKGTGAGGDIYIQAHDIKLSGAGFINSSGMSPNGGKAGSVLIESDSLTLLSGGNISVSSLGIGAPGAIKIKVSGNLLLSGEMDDGGIAVRNFIDRNLAAPPSKMGIQPADLLGPSKIDAAVISQGAESAGTIEIEAGRLEIRQGAEITSVHHGVGDAGNILIQAQEIHLKNGALTTETKGGGGGGNIDIRLPNLLYLVDGKVTTSVGTGKGKGGDVIIDHPQFVVLNQGQVKAQADEGQGGNIRIIAEQFVASADSLVSASSRLGVDGQVIISAPNEKVGNKLFLVLPANLKRTDEYLKAPCGARTSGNSFTMIHGEVPTMPDDFAPSGPLWAPPKQVKGVVKQGQGSTHNLSSDKVADDKKCSK